MRKHLLMILLILIAGCTPSRQRAKEKARFERDTRFHVPVASEEGKIKLAAIDYIIEEIQKDVSGKYFVPLDEKEIEEVHPQLPYKLWPATRAKWVKARGWFDKKTGQRGNRINLANPRIHGDRADLEAGYGIYSRISQTFYLLKRNQQWEVENVGAEMISDPLGN